MRALTPTTAKPARTRLNGRPTRRIAAVLAAACALSMALAPVAPAQTADGAFTDVAGAYYTEAVNALAADGVFDGTECTAGFCPDDAMDRKTMAVWLVRAVDGADPAATAASRFADVAAGSFHSPFIERLAELQVTLGCGDGTNYCPDDTVTRAEMAAFISRAFNLPDGADPGFADVPADAWYRAEVAKLAAARISVGCGDGSRFCPDGDTTRAEMATFVARATGHVQAPQGPPPAVLVTYERPASVEDHRAQPSPDRSHVAYYESHGSYDDSGDRYRLGERGTLRVAEADGTNLVVISTGVLGDDICGDGSCGFEPVIWSPDSSRFAYFVASSESASASLYVTQADGTNPTRIHDFERRLDSTRYSLQWSPDSTRIAYSIATDGWDSLHIVDADGTNATTLPRASELRWSPDSTRITYSVVSEHESMYETLYALHVAHADGTNPTTIADPGGSPQWSPDSSHIAYTTYADEVLALHIATADGTSTTTIADPGSGPQWSPDSSHIGYYTYADEVLALHIATADGTSTTRIADDLGRGLPRPQWSPDGSHIGYYTYADEVALHIATADGTNSAQLAVGYGFGLQLPRWSPDGSRVAYYRYADGELALHIATADGTSPTEIIGTGWWGPSQTAAFAWSPDSNRVAYTKLEPEERPEDLDLRDASSWPATHVFVEVVGIKGGNPVALQPSIYGAAAGERFCGVIALSWQRNGIRFDTEDWSNWC